MASSIRSMALVLGFALLAAPTAWAQGKGKAAPEEQTGLKVGTEAPRFTLKDQEGKERALDEFLKKGKVALVFYRSADWWPFCRTQLVQLQRDLKSLDDAGVQLVGISYDDTKILKTFSDRMKITFPLLSDPGSRTIEAYHILNPAARGRAEGVPYPGTFLLDQEGVIRAKLFLEGYRNRSSAEEIVKAAKTFK